MRLALALVSLCLALVALPGGAAAQTDKEIRESQRRLEQIRRERAQLRQEMSQIQGRVHDLSSELRNLTRQADASSDVLQELDYQLGQRQAQIQQTSQALTAAQMRLVQQKQTLHRRLREIYKRGPLHTVQVLLTADSFSDLLNRYKYLYLIARHDRNLVQQVAVLEEQLVVRERLLQHSMAELKQLQEEKAAEYEQLSIVQRQQERALSGARQRQQTAARRISQLERDEKRLSGLIATLEKRRKEAERRAAASRTRGTTPAKATPAASLTTRDLGNLGWPAEGRLLYRFGRDTQPNGTVLRRNGIGIGAAAGTAVRAVESGTVVMSGPFEGYGPTVVLSHGGGYYSLYLYLRDVSVAEGAQVARSQVVGTVGGDRTPEGAHLEFQIREPGGEAVDPLTWLRQRGTR